MNRVRQILGLPNALQDAGNVAQGSFDAVQKALDAITERLDGLDHSLSVARRDLRLVRQDTETTLRRSALILEPRRALALLTNGFQIYVDPQDRGGAVNLLTLGRIEEAEIKVLRRLLRPGMVMLDVGANYGYYSMVAAPFLRAGGKVIGFEPNPQLYSHYRNSIHLNGFAGIVEARAMGVSDNNGSIKFEVENGYPGGGRIPKPGEEPRPNHETLEVPTVRLDDHLPRDLVVDIVKIDVEGHEAHVLNGMREVIARSPNIVILMEFFFSFFKDEEAARDMLRLLTEELGLKVERIVHDGSVVPADFESLRGAECTLALSRGGLPAMPDLTVYPAQLHRGTDVQLVDNALVWERSGTGGTATNVAFGPYLHLPKGSYRVEIDAEFEGHFVCRLQDNYGDFLMEIAAEDGRIADFRLELAADARQLELVIDCRSNGNARAVFRKAEFRRA